MKEALKLALEALKAIAIHGDVECVVTPNGTIYLRPAITAIKEALAQEPWTPEDMAYRPSGLPQPDTGWTPERIAGMARLKAQQNSRFEPDERNFCPRCGKRTADLAAIHTCTPPIAADPKAFYGFPNGSVSTPNAGGKCVTAGETAPVKEIDPNAWAFDRGLEST